MALVALAPTAAVTIALLVPTGAFSVAFISTANATMQLNSIGEMRGRVMALYAIGFLGTTPIGSPIVGVLVTSAGPRVAIMAGALISLAVGGWLLLSQRLRA
jgi:MFS family permease